MDISSLPEAEQERLKPLQQHQQQQQQQQQQQYQYYDQTTQQPQPCDQSYCATYYPPYHQPPSSYDPYSYYPPTHYSAQFQHQPPPGAAAVLDSSSSSSAGAQIVASLNPAAASAVMALSQLTQFTGTMSAAEKAMANALHSSVGQNPYRGVPIGRGGRVSQGFVPGPLSQGRGRGRGKLRSKHIRPRAATSTSSHQEPSAERSAESIQEVVEPSVNATNNSVQVAPAPGKGAQNCRPAKAAWCELCRVDCTSLEILEQHKNGKRHKKNLLRVEELKRVVRPVAEPQNIQKPVNGSDSVMPQQPVHNFNCEMRKLPEIVGKNEESPTESLPSEVVNSEHGMQFNLQNNSGGQSTVPVNESSRLQARKEGVENRRHGIKRKMKGGRGGKRVRTSDLPKLPTEPPKPKVLIPLVCDLCNVKCDTQEVMNRHLSGKKHIGKLKRFEGHQAMYGPVGLQALYPPNPIVKTLSVPQSNQPSYNPDTSFHPPVSYFHSQAASTAAGSDHQFVQSSISQQSEAKSESGVN